MANGLPDRPLAEAAVRLLLQHGWKGNVRELDNCMHRAVLMATGSEIGPEAVLLQGGGRPSEPPGERAHAARPAIGHTVAEVERDLILDTLRHTQGNRTHAATVLGISIRTLRNKLRHYGEEGLSVPAPALGFLR
jgi:DNA-binding NtrC family response regulator